MKELAHIEIVDGLLIINFTSTKINSRLCEVKHLQGEMNGCINIQYTDLGWRYNTIQYPEYSKEDVKPEYIETVTHRPWFKKQTYQRAKSGFVQLKETKTYNITTTNYRIIKSL